jgi:hypothetical protein
VVRQIIEATVLLVALFLVISNAFGFSQAIGAIANAYTGAVRTLQGR